MNGEKEVKDPKEKWKRGFIQILAICNNRHNYIELFEGVMVDGVPVKVDQAMWDEISLSCYEKTPSNPFGIVAELKEKRKEKPLPNSNQFKGRTCQPDIVLMRNICRGTEKFDNRNVLFGLMYSGIPCVNSAKSVYACLERPIVHGELLKIQEKLGKDEFPLIPQYYHCYGNDINFPPGDFPVVAKISHTHAGYGKTLVESSDRLRDIRSIVQIHDDYTTTEKFVEADYELRLQKIGNHYRAMKKQLVSYWKSNVLGTAAHENIKLEPIHKVWLDECSTLFGGLDIFALDVLHSEKDDRFYILELNDTAIGFGPDHVPEDLQCIKEVVIQKIQKDLLDKKKKKEENEETEEEEEENEKEEKKEYTVKDWEIEKENMRNEMMEKDKLINEANNMTNYYKNKLNELMKKKKKSGFFQGFF